MAVWGLYLKELDWVRSAFESFVNHESIAASFVHIRYRNE